MKIMIISAMFPPIRTGTSFYSINLAHALKKRNNQITIVTVKNHDSIRDNFPFKVLRLKALYIPLKNYFKHLRICSIFPSNYAQIGKTIKNNRPDVILLVNHYLDIGLIASFAAKKYHIPLIVSIGTQIQSLNPIRNKILHFFDKIICGHILSCAQKIIAWDKEIMRYLLDVQGTGIKNKIEIINFGVNGDSSLYIHKHNYKNVSQIIAVGAVIEQRNFQSIITHFRNLLDTFPQLTFKIIGHVYYQPTVNMVKKYHMEKKVLFAGELSHEKVLKEFKKSTLCWGTLTGEYIGLGTSNLEAMMLGIPVISNVPNDLLGKPKLKNMENYIFLKDNYSNDQTRDTITKLLTDYKLRKKIGTGGKKFVLKYLSWNRIAQEMQKIFNNTIS